ncbi:MAG: hypothetical protein JMM75_01250 [Candidatus Xiphinematobacter sp.]|nr:MAG: hypothetical protein JMM75_01250 [Candidatus Xiphinematobacter sp.]
MQNMPSFFGHDRRTYCLLMEIYHSDLGKNPVRFMEKIDGNACLFIYFGPTLLGNTFLHV